MKVMGAGGNRLTINHHEEREVHALHGKKNGVGISFPTHSLKRGFMKKIVMLFCTLLLVSGSATSALAAYANTNRDNVIDWYNIIDGVKERDFRSVSSKKHAPFYFNFNGFSVEQGASYEMTLRHGGNSNNKREQWKLYLEGDNSRMKLDDLFYSNDMTGYHPDLEWGWVDQKFLVSAGDIASVGENWSFVLEPGTKRYSVLDLDRAGISSVPVPGALYLLGSGLVAMMGLRKKVIF
jgi:hypothetical protein